jgi:hypothetical protein
MQKKREKPRRNDQILAIGWGTEDGNQNAFFVKKLRTWYLACHIAGRGILDEKNVGEALSRVEALYKGILQFFSFMFLVGMLHSESLLCYGEGI